MVNFFPESKEIVWFLRYWVRKTEFFVILDCFLPFYPSINPENQNFNKNEKNTWRYYHFTNINNSHMMYGSSDMECTGHCFLPFYPPMDPENQNFQNNGKNTWRYYHFTNINNTHMRYGSSDMECNWQNFLSFWTIFCPFTPRKIKILKKS